jgi:predicted porin
MVTSYALSYARQWETSGFAGKPFGHNYWSLSATLEIEAWKIGAGYESLGGNGNHGFTTPLATLHKFNGFADVFLGASATGALVNGLEDFHLEAEYLVPLGNGLRVSAIHHWFRSLRESTDYGHEVDLVASYAFNKNWSALGKYGQYSTRGGSGGIGARDKEMLTLEINFIY